MQNFGVTNKEHYGMLWYFWSGQFNEISSCEVPRLKEKFPEKCET